MSVTVPPLADFTSYSNLLQSQRDHLGKLGNYAGMECDNTTGLDNLLAPLRGPVDSLSTLLNNKLFDCQGGMGDVSGKVLTARQDYADADKNAEADIKGAYPAVVPGFIEIPSSPSLGNFDDVDIDLKPPTEPEDPVHINLIAVGNSLAAAEHVWKWFTGESLLEKLVTPITGSYTRLSYLQEAYGNLAGSTYTVAGNLRRGTWKLASEWNGEAATAFEYHMFRWHMGIGGLGDLATIASNLFRDFYKTISLAVNAILRAISELIEKQIKPLCRMFGEMVAGDAVIEGVELGPEDPLADIAALTYSGYKLYKMYKRVRMIITAISVIETSINKARDVVEKLKSGISDLHTLIGNAMKDPSGTAKDMMNDAQNRGLEFEKNGSWNTKIGATRIGMLPTS